MSGFVTIKNMDEIAVGEQLESMEVVPFEKETGTEELSQLTKATEKFYTLLKDEKVPYRMKVKALLFLQSHLDSHSAKIPQSSENVQRAIEGLKADLKGAELALSFQNSTELQHYEEAIDHPLSELVNEYDRLEETWAKGEILNQVNDLQGILARFSLLRQQLQAQFPPETFVPEDRQNFFDYQNKLIQNKIQEIQTRIQSVVEEYLQATIDLELRRDLTQPTSRVFARNFSSFGRGLMRRMVLNKDIEKLQLLKNVLIDLGTNKKLIDRITETQKEFKEKLSSSVKQKVAA